MNARVSFLNAAWIWLALLLIGVAALALHHPAGAWASLGVLPLLGMAVNKSTTMDGWEPPFTGEPPSPLHTPPYLFYIKCAGDAFIKALTGCFHLVLLSSAMPYQEEYLGEIPGIGHVFTGLFMGDLTLGALMAFLLTLGCIVIPVVFWYVSLTTRIFEDHQGFWRESKTNGIVFASILGVFIGLQVMEFSLLFQRIHDVADPVVIGGITLEDEASPNVWTMGVLSFLVMGLNFLFGWVTARLIIQVEKGEIG